VERMYLRQRCFDDSLVWINFGLSRILNICGKPTYPGPEVHQKNYVITMMKLIRSWYIEAEIEA